MPSEISCIIFNVSTFAASASLRLVKYLTRLPRGQYLLTYLNEANVRQTKNLVVGNQETESSLTRNHGGLPLVLEAPKSSSMFR